MHVSICAVCHGEEGSSASAKHSDSVWEGLGLQGDYE